jgi:twinkle protein
MNDPIVEQIGGPTSPREIYEQAYRSLDPFYHLRKPKSFEDAFMCIVEGRRDGTPCPMLPKLGLRPGEVTIWGGINGHGKSAFTGQIALMLAEQGERPCVVSLEMAPERTLYRMCSQWLGHEPKTEQDGARFLNHVQERMLFFDYVGQIELEVLFGAITIAARQRQCSHVFIDNLMCCVPGEDTYNLQKDFVGQLCALAKQLHVHIHLIHHVRKGKDEFEEIGKFSFRGTSAIVDQVDNCVTIQRNKLKEKKREEGQLSPIEDHEEADVILAVCKQRNGRWEGRRWLWFEPESGAYCIDGDRKTPWEVKA